MSTNFGIKDTNAFKGFLLLSFELESDINFTKSVAIYLLRSFHNGLHAVIGTLERIRSSSVAMDREIRTD